MKSTKYLLLMAVVALGWIISACTKIENKEILQPYTYDDLYYQNLRDFKATDHEISFGWFAQYGQQNSLAVRFLGLPDSLDICSLWGGIPTAESTDVWEELRFVQKVKGTKMLCVAIVRLQAETDDHDFKQAFNEAYAMEAGEERTQALYAAIEMYADYFLDQIFENDLDGFDADYEPEGDFLSGDWFIHFMEHLSLYLGPNPDITKEERLKLIQERYGPEYTDTDKLLCIDSNYAAGNVTSIADLCDYFFVQVYDGQTTCYNWPWEKSVLCSNMADNWAGTMDIMYMDARYEPDTGHKGGFGTYYIHRDYNVHENNPYPYKRFRECIQIINPAVH
ncbi:MAG: glycoside hydrolase family 18 [Clostridia bacterium]|nr:glycoside hydrolase family 18 [Clostridia bacterium]